MEIIPAPTKVSVIKETAELLCKIAVEKKPVKMERILPLVDFLIKVLNALPESCLMASSKRNIPNMKIPSPARNFQKSKSDHCMSKFNWYRLINGNKDNKELKQGNDYSHI